MMTPSDAFNALVNGMENWDFPSDLVPCELLLVGKVAFPVMVNNEGQVLIAASYYGQGRMVILSHEDYLEHAGLAPFLCNAVNWLCNSPGAAIGVHRSVEGLANILCDYKVEVQTMDDLGDSLGVYCINARDSTLTKKLIQFVKNGGGLLIAGQAWNWASEPGHDKVLTNYSGNQVTSVAGVYFTATLADTDFPKIIEVPQIPLTVRVEEELFQDQEQLLNGIPELNINMNVVPSQLLVHGVLAFPLGLHSSLGCFLAGARYGQGRVVLAGHENILSAPTLGPFLSNALQWLAGGQKGRVGVDPHLKNLCPWLSANGLQYSLETQLTPDLTIYCCTVYSDPESRKLLEFVAEGGGLLIGGQAWLWASQNPSKSVVADFPGNHLLNSFGLSILGCTLKNGSYSILRSRTKIYHFRWALSQFHAQLNGQGGEQERGWCAKLGQDCRDFLKIPTEGNPLYSSVHIVLWDILRITSLPHVSWDHPVDSDSNEAVLLYVATELAKSEIEFTSTVHKPWEEICPSQLHLLAPSFTIKISGTSLHNSLWESTGLYLPEGCMMNIMMPLSAVNAGLEVQIGCHSDDLTGASKLYRAPMVIQRKLMNKTKLSVFSPWGGLIYIIVPKGSNLGPVTITITGAIPAPYFKLGKTSLEKWNRSLWHYQAPWGELAADSIILTVPTKILHGLEDPESLLRLWEEMMGAVARLAAITTPLSRPERIVADIQISAGSLHAGYPVMCSLESVQKMVNEKTIRSSGLWDFIHELGQNQQCKSWEFPPHTTEATCNLWSIYVHEKVLDISRSKANPEMNPSKREKRIQDHMRKGAPLGEWKMWTALETYLQLQESFGWDPYIQVFRKYQALSEVPEDKISKMNLWVKMFSQQVQRNLAPFFQMWGWPVQKEVAASLSSFPEWQENPMNEYILKEN